jgi:hypothetical protein
VAFEVSVPPDAGGVTTVASVSPGPLRALLAGGGTRRLGDFAAWDTIGRGSFLAGVLTYDVAGPTGYLAVRPQGRTQLPPVPVLVTPALARQAVDGALPVRLPGIGQVQLRVAGTVAHVPTTGSGQAAVADVGRLYAALNALYPGLGSVSERWTDRSRAPALRLSDLLRAAREDPLARGVLLGLRVLALLAGLAALAAVCLAVAATARDRGGEQAELEALGIPPRTLRAQMVATAAATAVAGLLAGLAGGAALASAFADLVALGADGRRPLPDLLAAYPWAPAAGLAAAVACAAALAAAWQGRRAFRGPALGRLRG